MQIHPSLFCTHTGAKKAAASAAAQSTSLPAKAEVMAKKYQFRGLSFSFIVTSPAVLFFLL